MLEYLNQLYGITALLLFTSVAFFAARIGGWKGVLVGHFVLAIAVAIMDVKWIQEVMAKPGWDGTPDMDMFFHFGVMIRVFLINTLLLPFSLLGIWIRNKKEDSSQMA